MAPRCDTQGRSKSRNIESVIKLEKNFISESSVNLNEIKPLNIKRRRYSFKKKTISTKLIHRSQK